MNEDELFHNIASKNHWRVNIRPSVFENLHVPTLSECWNLVESAQVRLRGWYYPHIQDDYRAPGKDWIESGFRREGQHQEVWRMYQSGQFVHYLVLLEDHLVVPWSSSAYPGGRPERYLEIISVIYRITEVFEFASRLASRGVLQPDADISIQITGLKGRSLVYWQMQRSMTLYNDYVANRDQLQYERSFTGEELIGHPGELALDVVVWMFERFGWYNQPRQVFAEDQRRLYERML